MGGVISRALRWLVVLGFGATFALGAWLRATSLENLPMHLGDESYHGLQVLRMLSGESFTVWTTSGNLIDPFYAVMQVPFLAIDGPSLWALRMPAVLSGVLAFALLYVLGSRILDRPTAMIAAGLLAMMPAAVIFSRFACEFSQSPLAGLICLYFAFRGNGRGVLASSVVALIVHQTNIFLGPAVVGVYLTQALRRTSGDPSARRRLIVSTLASAAAFAAVIGLITFARPVAKSFYGSKYVAPDWPRYLLAFGRFFLGDWSDPMAAGPGGGAGIKPEDFFLWIPALAALAFGGWSLVRERRWDRLALIAGLAVSAAGLHVVGGTRIFHASYRYGAFLLVPTALAIAVLVRPLLVAPGGSVRGALRCLQLLAVPLLAWPLANEVNKNWFRHFSHDGAESVWTLRTEVRDAHPAFARRVVEEALRTRTGPGPVRVISEDWVTYPPLAFFTHKRRELVSVEFLSEGEVAGGATQRSRLRGALLDDALIVCEAGGVGEANVRSMLPVACLFRMDHPSPFGERGPTLYRRNPDIPAPADYDGDGRADPAVYHSDEARWEIRLDGGGEIRLAQGTPGPSVAAPADYDGDGRAEAATSRIDLASLVVTGLVSASEERHPIHPEFDVAVAGDFDGDGRADPASFGTANAAWHVRLSGGGEIVAVVGRPGSAIPVPADYDGDGRTDVAAYHPSDSMFQVRQSSDGRVVTEMFGVPNASIPVPADYDGDGRADLAVYKPITAEWLILRTTEGPCGLVFGPGNRDIPVPADYDGDGRADVAVFEPETGRWLVQGSRQGQWSLAFDVPDRPARMIAAKPDDKARR